MTLYSVDDNTIEEKQWTWAWTALPDLATISKRCDVCNRGRLYPGRYPERALDAEVEDGTSYPDILGCGSHSFFIISEAALLHLQSGGVESFQPFPLNIIQATGSVIETVTPPRYHHLKIAVGCEVDFPAMGVSVLEHCPKCYFTLFDPLHDFGFSSDVDLVVKENSLCGYDLFISEFLPCVAICTSRFKDVVEQNHSTNFEFTEISTS